MKKIVGLLFVLLFLTQLCACSILYAEKDGPNTLEPPADFKPDVDLLPGQDESGDQTDDTVQDPASPFGPYGELADEAHLAFYNRALKMYAWTEFGTGSLELNIQDSIEVEGLLYYKVLDPLFDTPDKLQSELSSCFSDDICSFITETVFIERDGFLYALDMARGADITILDEELHLTEETESKRTYTMVVSRDEDFDTIADTTETYVYEAEKIGGTFKFTVFPFYL